MSALPSLPDPGLVGVSQSLSAEFLGLAPPASTATLL